MSVCYMQFSLSSNHILLDERLHYSPIIVSIKIYQTLSLIYYHQDSIIPLLDFPNGHKLFCFVMGFFCFTKYILKLE